MKLDTLEKPTLENPTQINKDILNTNLPKKDKSIMDLSNTDSFPILSQDPFPFGEDAAEPTERKGKEAATQSAVEIYWEIIKDKGYNNIGQRKSHTVRRKSSAMWLFLYPI